MASPIFGTASSVTGVNAVSTKTVPVPASTAADDVVVIVVYRESLSNTVTVTGFLKPSNGASGFDEIPNTNHSLYIGYKRLTGADAGNYTVNFSASNSWTEIAALRITGCITTGNPFDVVTSATTASATTSPNVAVTTTVADTLLVLAACAFVGSSSWTSNGVTERTDTGDALTTGTTALADAGASGNKSATFGGSAGRMTSWLGALKSPSASFDPKKASEFLMFF